MRPDMHKVIVNRAKTSGSSAKGRVKSRNLEDLPQHEGMRRPHRVGDACKLQNIHLAPLRRYLASHVGQPWNKVYSEICKNVNLSSEIQRNLLRHVQRMVYTKAALHEDKIVLHSEYSVIYLEDIRKYSGVSLLYVHPTTGKLQQLKTVKYTKKKDDKNFLKTVSSDDKTQCHKIKGIWYVIRLAKLPAEPWKTKYQTSVGFGVHTTSASFGVYYKSTPNGEIVDKMFGRCLCDLSKEELEERYNRSGVYCVSMRQCNSKMLKRFGVKND